MFSPSENNNFRQLEQLLSIIFDSTATEDKIMNVRSRLGKVLHFCCINDPNKALDMFIKRMESIKTTPGISIILLASASFILKYIPFDPNSDFANWITAPLLRHAVSADGNHVFNLIQFFRAGGTKLLPFPDVFLGELLLHSDNIGPNCAKPISYLISVNPHTYSNIFWCFFRGTIIDQNVKNVDQFLALLSKIVSFGEIIPPNDPIILSGLINSCEFFCGNDKQFHEIEVSLTVLRWLIANKSYCPEKLSMSYSNIGLNALVVDCWAEYSAFGDLSKVPKFKHFDEVTPQIQNIYVKLIRNSSQNPNFSFKSIEISHWLWDEILIEFAGKKRTKELYNSLYDLGNNELMYCADIAYILPEWFFLHALRLRCHSSEISARILKIMNEVPFSIVIENMVDFINFIDHHLSFPQNACLIADCIRNLIIVLLPRMNPLIEKIISSIDYFDETNLTSRLIILNTIFCFGVETESFLDVFDNVWECFPLIHLSLSLCEAIFKFFTLIAPFVPSYADKLFDIAIASLCSFCINNEPSFVSKFEQAHIIFTSCQRFYSIVSSDIVTNPNYTAQSSYPLAPLGLLLIKKLPHSIFCSSNSTNVITNSSSSNTSNSPQTSSSEGGREGLSLLFECLPTLLSLCPVETLAVVNYFIDAKFEFKKQLLQICANLKKELAYNDSIELAMIVMPFKARIAKLLPQESFVLKPSNVESFGDDIDATRLTLQADPVLLPLMLMKTNQLSLLLELWAPQIDDSFLNALSVKMMELKNWKEIRICRSFLAHFNYKQPEYCSYDSWVHRECCEDGADHPITSSSLNNNKNKSFLDSYETDETVIAEIGKHFPIDTKLNKTELIISIAKNYRFNPQLIKPICYMISRNTDECVKLGKDRFWFLRFLFVNGVGFNFPEKTANDKCISFGIRNKFLKFEPPVFTSPSTPTEETTTAELILENTADPPSIDDDALTINDLSEEWQKIDAMYIYPLSVIEKVSQSLLTDHGRVMYARFLPKWSIVPSEQLVKLMNHPLAEVGAHILDYLIVFTSKMPNTVVDQFLVGNESTILHFMNRIDLKNPIAFEELELFVNTVCLMRQYGAFSSKMAESFLRNVLCFETGICAACVYELLPMLKKIFRTSSIRPKAGDHIGQFLHCLKQGLPAVREFIPDFILE